MAGLGGLERRIDRLCVADLAHHDHVGILAQRGAERRGEARRIRADLALGDDRVFVREDELDRILDRHDLALAASG